jgi:hypothetical protein
MSAPTGASAAPADAQEAAEALTLLDTLARAPVAADLIVAALGPPEMGHLDRKTVRLVHPLLRDAVGEATTRLLFHLGFGAPARPPTPRRWPRFEELHFCSPDAAALEALGSETWGALRELHLDSITDSEGLGVPSARALAATLRRMPALRVLGLIRLTISDAAAAELFPPASADAPLQLRSLTLSVAALTPAVVRVLAGTGWRLEELDLSFNPSLGAAGVAALARGEWPALKRLDLRNNGISPPPTLEDARRWAPALVTLLQ